MTTQTSKALVPVADTKVPAARQRCCESGRANSRTKWLMIAAAGLLVIGLVTGSAVLGFVAIAPLLYVLPCLAVCGMCLLKHGGTSKT